jgi:hypothetical protein
MHQEHDRIETTARKASQGRGWASWPMLVVLVVSLILAILAGAGFLIS